jgi:hypothetical protein
MASCTDTSSRATTLLSCPPLRPMTGAALRPVTAPGARVAARRGWQATSIAPVFGGFEGGAIAATGTAAVTDLMVTDLMVTDHTYSTRLGPPSCSPPV